MLWLGETESQISVWHCLLVGCLTSQQQASVSQGQICSDNFTCCHTEIEAAHQMFYLTQSQYTDTGPTSLSTDPITPGAWQGSLWSANFWVTSMTPSRKNPDASGIRTQDLPLPRQTPYHEANEAVSVWQHTTSSKHICTQDELCMPNQQTTIPPPPPPHLPPQTFSPVPIWMTRSRKWHKIKPENSSCNKDWNPKSSTGDRRLPMNMDSQLLHPSLAYVALYARELDAHCLSSVGQLGYFCRVSRIWVGCNSSVIRRYSFCMRVCPPSIGLNSSRDSRCSYALDKEKQEMKLNSRCRVQLR